MFRLALLFLISVHVLSCNPKLAGGLRRNDLKKDVKMVTTHGTMTIRLYDATPLHRDNFLKLVKQGFYNTVLFHRVISGFMIQAGDPVSKTSLPGVQMGNGGPGYTIPAEFRPALFHRKGAVAAARQGDDVNPERKSSGSQFYIVQGKTFTDGGLDSVETFRLKGRKLDPAHREAYKTQGGAPHLDQNYTIFGELTSGYDVLDKIAAEKTSNENGANRPVNDVRIIKAFLIKRKSRFN